MRMSRKIFGGAGLIGLIVVLGLALPGCNKLKESNAALEEIATNEKPAAETPEPTPKPAPPKVTEETYIEMTARSAMIWEKYKDDTPSAEKAIEAMYEKFGITHEDYRAYQAKLTSAKAMELQSKIQEFIQKILNEYR